MQLPAFGARCYDVSGAKGQCAMICYKTWVAVAQRVGFQFDPQDELLQTRDMPTVYKCMLKAVTHSVSHEGGQGRDDGELRDLRQLQQVGVGRGLRVCLVARSAMCWSAGCKVWECPWPGIRDLLSCCGGCGGK